MMMSGDEDFKFKQVQITPLGAAVVEALPDRVKVAKIKKRFRDRQEVPVSRIFTSEDIRKFYEERGEKVVVVEA